MIFDLLTHLQPFDHKSEKFDLNINFPTEPWTTKIEMYPYML